MSDENKQIINSFKNQIIALIFALLAIIISISILNTFIKYYQNKATNEEYLKAQDKSKFVVLIYIVVTFYFAYIAYKNYKKNKTNTNFNFLVAVLLILIANVIRFINLNKVDINENASDFSL